VPDTDRGPVARTVTLIVVSGVVLSATSFTVHLNAVVVPVETSRGSDGVHVITGEGSRLSVTWSSEAVMCAPHGPSRSRVRLATPNVGAVLSTLTL
jgi:hypothetical protein